MLYRRIMGPIVGIAALAALTASLPFLELSAMATSDVFFFAIWTCALLVASHALDANRGPVWLAAGLLAGIVILCRTNGIVIGILVFAPFMPQWRCLRKRAGVEGFRFHDFWHDFGSKLLRETQNLKLVQRAMNHANITTTTRYAHVLDGDVAAALERHQQSRNKSRNGAKKVG